MANDISLTSPVRNNLLSLQNTADLLASTQQRLATGKKVNSALDNPQSFFTAASLNSRASDLSALLDSSGQAVQTLNAADAGISGISSLVANAKAVLIQAQDTKISGSSTSVKISSAGDVPTALSSADGKFLRIGVKDAAGTETFISAAITTGDSVSTLVSNINSTATAGNTPITASFSGDTLTISATNGRDLRIFTADATTDTTASTSATSTLDGTFTNGVNRDSYVTTYNNLLTQIDQLASDASYKGVNLLSGDNLTVYFNEDQTSSLTIEGADLKTTGALSLSATTATALETDSNIVSSLTAIDQASSSLRTQASKFGSNLSVVETRSDFTEALISTLESGSGLLTLADANEEGANLLALQTRQQLSTISLSLASQADQAVLRLF